MAQRRGVGGRGHSLSSPLPRKKYLLRRSPLQQQQPDIVQSEEDASRGVLLPLHPNLRRLPSRLFLKVDHNDQPMTTETGQKRKRSNENTRLHGRPNTGHGRIKRLKALHGARQHHSSDDESDVSHESEPEDSNDHYYLNSAPESELLRLRKDELIRLYTLSGLADEADSATKADLADAIISARDDIADLPPSSPRGDGASSSCESEDAADDFFSAKHITPNFRRRATTSGDPTRSVPRPAKTRTMSWIPAEVPVTARRKTSAAQGNLAFTPIAKRLRTSTEIVPQESISSPVVTRTRARKNSSADLAEPVTPTKGKGKVKQVEFTNSALHLRTKSDIEDYLAQDSDLTDLEESTDAKPPNPSPRRLRSKDRKEAALSHPPITPSTTCHLEPHFLRSRNRRSPSTQHVVLDLASDEDDDDSQAEVDQVDELISTASGTPQPSRSSINVERTPVKRRLRSSGRSLQSSQITEDDGDMSDNEDSGSEMEEGSEADEEEENPVQEGRRLRNGKIVGEDDDVSMHTADEASVASDEASNVDNSEEEASDELASDEAEEEEVGDEDEALGDEEYDLSEATAKSLTRLRRDDLVRLCETRDLEPVGTKTQLAETLLQWRDHQTQFSDPSSAATLLAPDTAKRGRKGGKRRSSHGTSEPKTVTPSKETSEPDVELDLESLGLDDREIPPEKLTKLEKIGSGGFKDVFIGKYRGRKVAISEFRGQLTAMDIKELKLLGGFSHPNIVRFLGVSIPENTRETPVMIVSELCSNGDLFDYVRNVPPPSLSKVLQLMLDIAKGLEYLHNRKPSIIHRDCKSSNILITSKVTAKIADFGLAKVKQSTRSMVRSLVGTVNWQAPELWHPHPKYNHKVDVFSCAMVYWEMLQWHQGTKKFPWEGMNEHAIYDVVGAKHQRPSIAGLKKLWCPEIVELMEHMWAQDPQDRPTISEVVTTLEDLVATYK